MRIFQIWGGNRPVGSSNPPNASMAFFAGLLVDPARKGRISRTTVVPELVFRRNLGFWRAEVRRL